MGRGARHVAVVVVGLLVTLPAVVGAADLLGEIAREEAAVEAQVRFLVSYRLNRDRKALAAAVADLETRDRLRGRAGRPATGLVDNARYLAASLEVTRDGRRVALRALRAARLDPTLRRIVEHRLAADDAAAADRLLADDRHNRRAHLVNDALRPLGVFSGAAFLAALNPLLLAGSAVDSLATTAVNLWRWDRLSTPEREALARYRELLRRAPDTQEAPEIASAIRRLGARRGEAFCKETVEQGRRALADEDVDHALFHLRAAARIEGCAARAETPLARARERWARRAARLDAARWPADDPPRPAPGAEETRHHALLVATALGDPTRIAEAADVFRRRHGDGPLADAALYALAVARHRGGDPVAGRAALVDLADEDGSSAARRAAAILASADYSPLDALADAERRHRRDTLRYVLLGGGPDGRTALYGATRLGAYGARALETLGLANVLGMLTRAWQVWRRDPVSNQAIITQGETYLARHPDSADAAGVHARLADAYERAGLPARALMHLEATPRPSPKRVRKLQERLATDLVAGAERAGNDPPALRDVVRRFPDTDAAERARTILRERTTEDALVLTRAHLEAHPALLGPDALDLEPTLLDGDRANGELADAGVTLEADTLRLAVRPPDGDVRTETRPLAAPAYTRARAAAQDALYGELVVREPSAPEAGRFERYVPFFVQGSVGEGGVAMYPGLKLRRYRSDAPELYR
jgi:hypothetical protein